MTINDRGEQRHVPTATTISTPSVAPAPATIAAGGQSVKDRIWSSKAVDETDTYKPKISDFEIEEHPIDHVRPLKVCSHSIHVPCLRYTTDLTIVCD